MTDPPASTIRDEVSRILAAEPFRRGEKLRRFLHFIVEETLEGRAANLKEYSIGVNVYERPESYDPKVDSIVRVGAGRLRTRLLEYYAGEGKDRPVRIGLPKGTYVPSFVAHEVASAATAPAPPRATPIARRAGELGAVAVLAAAAALVWAGRSPSTTLAFAPFVALDGNLGAARSTSDQVSRLVPQELGWELERVEGKNEEELLAAARKIHATYLLSGSSRHARVTVTLHAVDMGFRLWNRSFDAGKPLDLVAALRRPPVTATYPGTTNREAARLYLEGYRVMTTGVESPSKPRQWPAYLARSLQLYEEALAADPGFGAAWAAKAFCLQRIAELDEERPDELRTQAQDAALRALSIDDTLAGAHSVLSMLALFRDWNLKEANTHAVRATDLDPRQPKYQRWLAATYSLHGKHEAAISELARAELSSPAEGAISASLAEAYFLARRYDEARREARRAISLKPEDSFAHWLLAVNSQLVGDHGEAEREYNWCLQRRALDARAVTGMAHLRAIQGRKAEAKRMLDGAIRRWGSTRGWNCGRAFVLAALGELDPARAALQQGLDMREGSSLWVLVDPRYDALRATPEYRGLEAKVVR